MTNGRRLAIQLPGGYGPVGSHQYDRLATAIALDRTAALRSASWGLGQILGENFAMSGFSDVESMVAAMSDSEDIQLAAVVSFVDRSGFAASLQQHNWAAFAARYNGPSYSVNQYDVKLAAAFQTYSSGGLPDLSLRAAQLYLTFGGYSPGANRRNQRGRGPKPPLSNFRESAVSRRPETG